VTASSGSPPRMPDIHGGRGGAKVCVGPDGAGPVRTQGWRRVRLLPMPPLDCHPGVPVASPGANAARLDRLRGAGVRRIVVN
jgi:hypothetical protein